MTADRQQQPAPGAVDGQRVPAAALRSLPSVQRLATAVARAELDARRHAILDGDDDDDRELITSARSRLRPSLRRVLNATGVVLHTNLGRTPLARVARDAVAAVAAGYCNLEYDLDAGARSTRHIHVEELLCELTGAEAALVVNNDAAAALLAVAAMVPDGDQIVVSRGQLVEIGGGFRVPEVVRQAGARMVEVGTTNRTCLEDYEAALGPNTAGILWVHPSNFRTVGFVSEVGLKPLAQLGFPLIVDAGSGVLSGGLHVLAGEPVVPHAVRAGAALTAFSGDKLLGGPQAGLLVGSRDPITAARKHPLARALRIDKLSLAALNATLLLHRDPELARRELPVLAMLDTDAQLLAVRASTLARAVAGEVVPSIARAGGGALPLLELPGPAVALKSDREARLLARTLRSGDPPVIARIQGDRVLLDPRTIADDELPLLIDAVLAAQAKR